MWEEIFAGLERLKRNRKFWEKLDADDSLFDTESDELLEEGYGRESYRDSIWYRFCQRDLSDLNSRDGKTFRLRFTVPYELFKQLLTFAER
jgi:hypothetical protein